MISEQLRQKSYSSVKLMGHNSEKEQNTNKLRSRGSSFAKLPSKIKWMNLIFYWYWINFIKH